MRLHFSFMRLDGICSMKLDDNGFWRLNDIGFMKLDVIGFTRLDAIRHVCYQCIESKHPKFFRHKT